MGYNLFGGYDRRYDDFYPKRRPCDTCRPYGPRRGIYDRYDDRYCPGCRPIFPRFPRIY